MHLLFCALQMRWADRLANIVGLQVIDSRQVVSKLTILVLWVHIMSSRHGDSVDACQDDDDDDDDDDDVRRA